jgi:hypothetical protein
MDKFLAFLNRKRRARCSRRWQIMSDYSVSSSTEITAGARRGLSGVCRADPCIGHGQASLFHDLVVENLVKRRGGALPGKRG